MHDVIAYLKEAVQRGPTSGVSGCYVFRSDNVYARNMQLQAGIACEMGADFVLPAEALDAALARMRSVEEMKIEQDTVIIKSGRLKSTIQRVHEEPAPMPDMPEEWTPGPPGFAAALDLADDFVGDRSWTQGLRVWNDRITAASGTAIIDIRVPGLAMEVPKMLTAEVAKFIIAQGDPDEYSEEENAICFRWDDGRWMRAQLLTDSMPEELIQKIFEEAGEEAPVVITDEWRAAFEDAEALSDGKVGVTASGLRAIKQGIMTDVDLDTKVDSIHQSFWGTKHLGSVLKIAKSWAPANYPRPSLFIGGGFRGVVVGISG